MPDTPDTETVLQRIEARLREIATSGTPMYSGEADIVTGQPIMTPQGAEFSNLVKLRQSLIDSSTGVSANTAAQVASAARGQDMAAATAAANRQSEEKRAADLLKESERQTNLKSTLDLLEQDIKTGQLAASEATARISAATNAANIQRAVVSDFGKYALPAGAQTFPNEPLVALAQSMGIAPPTFSTGGTFGLNPGAVAAPIMSSVGQPYASQDAIKNAAAALAALGIPQSADGRAMRPPSTTLAGA